MAGLADFGTKLTLFCSYYSISLTQVLTLDKRQPSLFQTLIDVDIRYQSLLSDEWRAMEATTAICLSDEVLRSKFLPVFKLVFNIFKFLVKLLFGNLSETLFDVRFVVHNEALIFLKQHNLNNFLEH